MRGQKRHVRNSKAAGVAYRYLGLDVVRNVVADNQKRFAHEPNWAFDAMDFTQARAAL